MMACPRGRRVENLVRRPRFSRRQSSANARAAVKFQVMACSPAGRKRTGLAHSKIRVGNQGEDPVGFTRRQVGGDAWDQAVAPKISQFTRGPGGAETPLPWRTGKALRSCREWPTTQAIAGRHGVESAGKPGSDAMGEPRDENRSGPLNSAGTSSRKPCRLRGPAAWATSILAVRRRENRSGPLQRFALRNRRLDVKTLALLGERPSRKAVGGRSSGRG